MSINESDIELLETYLDGQMGLSEAEGLWRRLSVEKDLAAALVDLRAQREIRMAVWQSMEPSEPAAAALADRVNRSIHARTFWEYARRGVSYAVAAAACIVLGVQIGRMGPGGGTSGLAAGPAQQSAAQEVSMADHPSHGAFQVAIRDPNGNVIATPRFDTRQEAIDFVADLSSAQSRTASPAVESSERQNLGQNVVPASDEQF
jgi:hypothetical protein